MGLFAKPLRLHVNGTIDGACPSDVGDTKRRYPKQHPRLVGQARSLSWFLVSVSQAGLQNLLSGWELLQRMGDIGHMHVGNGYHYSQAKSRVQMVQ